jgi:hypothetical protein
MNVQFGKGEPHGTNEVVLTVNLKCGTFEFKGKITFCERDDVDLILV